MNAYLAPNKQTSKQLGIAKLSNHVHSSFITASNAPASSVSMDCLPDDCWNVYTHHHPSHIHG